MDIIRYPFLEVMESGTRILIATLSHGLPEIYSPLLPAFGPLLEAHKSHLNLFVDISCLGSMFILMLQVLSPKYPFGKKLFDNLFSIFEQTISNT